MKNPFKSDGYMLPIASINRHQVDGIQAIQMFSSRQILDKIKARILHMDTVENISKQQIFELFDHWLSDSSLEEHSTALEIIEEFSERLFRILVSLIRQDYINSRVDWNEEHWRYWSQIKKIYFAGGYLLPNISDSFQKSIERKIVEDNQSFDVVFIPNSGDLALYGMMTLCHSESLVFDFGQTSIKRARISADHEFVSLPSYESKYLFPATLMEVMKTAKDLDDFIFKTVTSTISQESFSRKNIYIALSNYVNSGHLTPANSGYGLLAHLYPDYQHHLETRLHEALDHSYSVTLFHDASAMALAIEAHAPTALISLGTAFGIAFI